MRPQSDEADEVVDLLAFSRIYQRLPSYERVPPPPEDGARQP